MKIFLDTNIVIDVLAKRQPFCTAAQTVVEYAKQNKEKLFCSSLTFSTAYYIIRRQLGHEGTIKVLKDFAKYCKTTVVDDDVVNSALNSDFKDFEDSMQYFSAVKTKADVIITRNKKDFELSQIPVKTPDEIFEGE